MHVPSAMPLSDSGPTTQRRSRWKLLLILLICMAPVLASYYTYYSVRPGTRSNYGDLIDPQRPVPALTLHTLDGQSFDAASLHGKWTLLMVDGGACTGTCEEKLYHMRQVRLTTGKERERVERVWLIPDSEPLPTLMMRKYEGTILLRASPEQLRAWLPVLPETTLEDHIYIVDPHANLMMRFPKNADPNKTKKDLARLLNASSIG